jgi:hypothetical protein
MLAQPTQPGSRCRPARMASELRGPRSQGEQPMGHVLSVDGQRRSTPVHRRLGRLLLQLQSIRQAVPILFLPLPFGLLCDISRLGTAWRITVQPVAVLLFVR